MQATEIDITTIEVFVERRKFVSYEVYVYYYSKYFMIHEPHRHKHDGYVLSTKNGYKLIQISQLSKLKVLCGALDKFIDSNYNGNFLRASTFNMLRWHNGMRAHPKFKWLACEIHSICTEYTKELRH